jgi:hypothetical protein
MRSSGTRILASLCLLCAATPPRRRDWREYPSIARGWSDSTEWSHEHRGEFVVGRLMFPPSTRRYVLGAGYGDSGVGQTMAGVDEARDAAGLARRWARVAQHVRRTRSDDRRRSDVSSDFMSGSVTPAASDERSHGLVRNSFVPSRDGRRFLAIA